MHVHFATDCTKFLIKIVYVKLIFHGEQAARPGAGKRKRLELISLPRRQNWTLLRLFRKQLHYSPWDINLVSNKYGSGLNILLLIPARQQNLL